MAWQGLLPACYGREKSEQGPNAALLSVSLPWSNVLLHGFVFTDLFLLDVYQIQWAAVFLAMCFDIL